MKVRSGFVSNSSSASFIIHYKTILDHGESRLTDEEVKKLEEFGFWKTDCHIPEQMEWINIKETKISEENLQTEYYKDYYNYGYYLSCNEYDVLDFLIENKIPFECIAHYGQYSIIYKRNSDEVIVFKNYGRFINNLSIFKRFEEDLKSMENEKPIKRIKLKDWKNEQYMF